MLCCFPRTPGRGRKSQKGGIMPRLMKWARSCGRPDQPLPRRSSRRHRYVDVEEESFLEDVCSLPCHGSAALPSTEVVHWCHTVFVEELSDSSDDERMEEEKGVKRRYPLHNTLIIHRVQEPEALPEQEVVPPPSSFATKDPGAHGEAQSTPEPAGHVLPARVSENQEDSTGSAFLKDISELEEEVELDAAELLLDEAQIPTAEEREHCYAVSWGRKWAGYIDVKILCLLMLVFVF